MGFSNAGLWIGFNIFVVAMLVLDLLVFHRKAHEVSVRESLITRVAWIALAWFSTRPFLPARRRDRPP
jgi:tellurite resistance protein TerC